MENSPENIEKIRKALSYLPDGEAHKISDTDLDQYRVLRVSGEITVELLGKACDVTYRDAIPHISWDETQGVKIPYLKPELLIRTKMGVRPKDVQDRNYLQRFTKEGKWEGTSLLRLHSPFFLLFVLAPVFLLYILPKFPGPDLHDFSWRFHFTFSEYMLIHCCPK